MALQHRHYNNGNCKTTLARLKPCFLCCCKSSDITQTNATWYKSIHLDLNKNMVNTNQFVFTTKLKHIYFSQKLLKFRAYTFYTSLRRSGRRRRRSNLTVFCFNPISVQLPFPQSPYLKHPHKSCIIHRRVHKKCWSGRRLY